MHRIYKIEADSSSKHKTTLHGIDVYFHDLPGRGCEKELGLVSIQLEVVVRIHLLIDTCLYFSHSLLLFRGVKDQVCVSSAHWCMLTP